jgi:hypothetical protein
MKAPEPLGAAALGFADVFWVESGRRQEERLREALIR